MKFIEWLKRIIARGFDITVEEAEIYRIQQQKKAAKMAEIEKRQNEFCMKGFGEIITIGETVKEISTVDIIRPIKRVIIHCSASGFGDANLIDKWHRQRDFRCIGYHYLILNDRPDSDIGVPENDGKIQKGRNLAVQGAHCEGLNESSIGICLIGDNDKITAIEDTFSPAQIATLKSLVIALKTEFPDLEISGHNEFAHKYCPCFDVQKWLKEVM